MSPKRSILLALLLSGLLLSGCADPPASPASPTQSALPTPPQPPTVSPTAPYPSPTPDERENEPSPTFSPSPPSATLTGSPTPFPITVDLPPSPTPEPGPPQAAILILSPGPLSRVSSPLTVRASLVPGAGGRIRIELFGEDGRLLVRKVLSFSLGTRPVFLTNDLEFEIAAVAEAGRLSVSVDDIFGRTRELASVNLILLNTGENDLNPPGDLLAPLVIEVPEADEEIEGGRVVVSGLARPGSENPLKIELLDRGGAIIGERLVAVAEGPPDEHRPFATEITYRVDGRTPARLVVMERGDRVPGTVHLTSLELILNP